MIAVDDQAAAGSVPNDPKLIARAIAGYERTDGNAPVQPDPAHSYHATAGGKSYIVLVNYRAAEPLIGVWTVRTDGRLMRLGAGDDWPDGLPWVTEAHIIRHAEGQYEATRRDRDGARRRRHRGHHRRRPPVPSCRRESR